MKPKAMRRPWRTGVVAVVIATVTVTACVADDAVRVLSTKTSSVKSLGTKTLPKLPTEQLPPISSVESEVVRIVAPVKDLEGKSTKSAIKSACVAKDLVEAGESLEDAVEFAIIQTGTAYTYKLKVEDLTEDLREADSSGEATSIVASAAICEAADHW